MTEEGWDHCCPWASAAGEWKNEERTELPREDFRDEESKRTSVEDGERDPAEDATPNAFPEGELTPKATAPENAPGESPQLSDVASVAPLVEDEPEPESTDTSSSVGAEAEAEVVLVEKELPEITAAAGITGDEVETASEESPHLSERVSSHAEEPPLSAEESGAPVIESGADSTAELEPEVESTDIPPAMAAEVESALGESSRLLRSTEEFPVSAEESGALGIESEAGSTAGFESEQESTDTSSTVDAEVESEVVSGVTEEVSGSTTAGIAGAEVETAPDESPQLSEPVSSHAEEPPLSAEESGAPDIESGADSTAELEPEPESTDTSSTVDAEVESEVVSGVTEEVSGSTTAGIAGAEVETAPDESPQLSEPVSSHAEEPPLSAEENRAPDIESESGSTAELEPEVESNDIPPAMATEVEAALGESSHLLKSAEEFPVSAEESGALDIETEADSTAELEPEQESTDTSSTVSAEVVSGVVLAEKAWPVITSEDGIRDDAVETAFRDSPAAKPEKGVPADDESEIASVTEDEQASESALGEAPGLSASEIQATLEAVIYAAGEPLTLREMKKILSDIPPEQVKQGIERLLETYSSGGRGLHIVQVAGGYQVTTRPEYHERVSAMFKAKPPTKLTIQALETLASIAYRQPVTVPEIMELRGVRSASVVRTLLERKLIRIVGRKNVVGRPLLYGTTKDFLVRFGLKDLNELPRLEDMADVFGEDIAMPVDEVNGERTPPTSEFKESAIPEAAMDGDQEDLDGSSSTPTGEVSGDPEEPNHENDPVS